MNVYLILVPVAVGMSSFLFIDQPSRWARYLGMGLLFGGLAAVMAFVLVLAHDADRKAEDCATQSGVMAAGHCYVGGARR